MTPRLCWARSEGITLQNLRHFPYVGLARPLNDRLLRTLPFPLHEHARAAALDELSQGQTRQSGMSGPWALVQGKWPTQACWLANLGSTIRIQD